jgi:hypothetical protein
MRIKLLKIKMDSDLIDVTIPDFTCDNTKILEINAELNMDDGKYYWFVLVAYVPKSIFISETKHDEKNNPLPIGFKREIHRYIDKHKLLKVRVKNCIKGHVNELIEIKKLDDFKKLRGMGVKCIFDEEKFLLGLIEIIKKFQYEYYKQLTIL